MLFPLWDSMMVMAEGHITQGFERGKRPGTAGSVLQGHIYSELSLSAERTSAVIMMDYWTKMSELSRCSTDWETPERPFAIRQA